MRVFLDTNVLVSAFATRGLCADVLRHILAQHDLIVGEVVIAELRRVLRDRIKIPAQPLPLSNNYCEIRLSSRSRRSPIPCPSVMPRIGGFLHQLWQGRLMCLSRAIRTYWKWLPVRLFRSWTRKCRSRCGMGRPEPKPGNPSLEKAVPRRTTPT